MMYFIQVHTAIQMMMIYSYQITSFFYLAEDRCKDIIYFLS